ncbi:MAG: alpha-amylase family glycosyl hydrolase, partial [Actinomycetota bacterium]|nr:alpha-amylase family glycosyl hydrolase [Actinomycetota bacterium]
MTEFFVWAPNAESVTLLHWHQGGDAAEEHPMTGGDDGVWRCETPALSGDHYLFRVRRGEESWDRIDPRAREVTNSVGRGVVPAPAPEHEPFTARPLNEWVIYELHAGTFGGDLAGSVDHLDELAALGVTTVELMPVAEFAGDQSWGYNPAMPFAVESSYGGPQALHHFVDACHQRGLAVVLDVVYNHLGPSDLDVWRFDGWGEGDGGGIYFYNDWRAATPWGATRPDYGRAEVRGFLLDNARMWLGEYALDGLRFDSTVNIRNAHGHGGPDGDLPDGWAFLQEVTDTLHHEFPGCVLIAEDMQGDPLVTASTAEDGLGFDAQWDAQFVHVVRAALTETHDESR